MEKKNRKKFLHKYSWKTYIPNKNEQTLFEQSGFCLRCETQRPSLRQVNTVTQNVKVWKCSKNFQMYCSMFRCLQADSWKLRQKSWQMHPKVYKWAGNLQYHSVFSNGNGFPSFTGQGEWLKLVSVHTALYVSLRDDYCENRILCYTEITWTFLNFRNSC